GGSPRPQTRQVRAAIAPSITVDPASTAVLTRLWATLRPHPPAAPPGASHVPPTPADAPVQCKPVRTAGGAAAPGEPRGEGATLRTPAGRQHCLGRAGGPLDAVPPPVHRAHPTTPPSEAIPGRKAPPTDAAGARGHPDLAG